MNTIAYTEHLTLRTGKRYEIIDITDTVERVRAAAKLRDGYVLVSTMHITSSIFVNDHEPGLWSDILTWVERLAPAGLDYRHHQTGEDNGDAHLKRDAARPSGHGSRYECDARSGSLGARSLRRVRRPASETDPVQGTGHPG